MFDIPLRGSICPDGLDMPAGTKGMDIISNGSAANHISNCPKDNISSRAMARHIEEKALLILICLFAIMCSTSFFESEGRVSGNKQE